MKSAAISAAFSFVTALGEFCSPASKTYSSVPPSLAAPRYRNHSTDMAGTASNGVIRIVAKEGIAAWIILRYIFPSSAFLNDLPRPCAILFVVARTLVHDGRPLVMPSRRTFVIQSYNAFKEGCECAECRSSRKIEGNYLP